eukprot:TRINITY_DN4200_c0_g2_i5.p1 TRINITY_DN4200_c0_g2~~TRINITY_DN4200_c0_g2_i5.p1  ORF type:complete len:502 (+),score=90.58 TRINITY_DN4200_c0_g2_i5:85-1590(+)
MSEGSNIDVYEHLFRLLCIGEELLDKFVAGRHAENSEAMGTIQYKSVSLKFDTTITRLQLLGFVGQQKKFQVLTSELFRAVHAVIVCYDTTDSQSLSYLQSTMREVRQFYAMTPKHILAIVGLQTNGKRSVDMTAIKELVTTERALYFETSLDSRSGVDLTFINVCRVILQAKLTGKHEYSSGVEAVSKVIASIAEAEQLLQQQQQLAIPTNEAPKGKEKSSPKKMLSWLKSPKQSRRDKQSPHASPYSIAIPDEVSTSPDNSPRSLASPMQSPHAVGASPSFSRKHSPFRHITPEVSEFLTSPPTSGSSSLASSFDSWDGETGPLVQTASSPEFTAGHIRDIARMGRRSNLFGVQRSPSPTPSTVKRGDVTAEALFSRLQNVQEEQKDKDKAKEKEKEKEKEKKEESGTTENSEDAYKEEEVSLRTTTTTLTTQTTPAPTHSHEDEKMTPVASSSSSTVTSTVLTTSSSSLDALGNELIDAFISGNLDFSELAALTSSSN